MDPTKIPGSPASEVQRSMEIGAGNGGLIESLHRLVPWCSLHLLFSTEDLFSTESKPVGSGPWDKTHYEEGKLEFETWVTNPFSALLTDYR